MAAFWAATNRSLTVTARNRRVTNIVTGRAARVSKRMLNREHSHLPSRDRQEAVPAAAAALLLCFAALATAAGIPKSEYKARRAELRKSLDGVMVLFGATEPADLHNSFFQESNFLYLSGWQEPGAAMMLTRGEEIIFLPPRNALSEIFSGRRTLPGDPDAAEKTGFEKVLPTSALESTFLRLLAQSNRIYMLPGDERARKLQSLGVLHESADAAAEIARLRVRKSPAEIELIQKSVNAAVAAHLAAWKRMKPGLFEYQIAAAITDNYLERGCERSAYAPIVGSGPDSVILHSMSNRRPIESGDLVVMDAGAECSAYASDVTRTVPATGKFTARQREIYDIVLGAQKAAIAAVRPGIRLQGDAPSLYRIAYDYIDTHGSDLHGNPLGRYFTHGLGHFVGLDVHDPGDLNQPLRPGMVITIEPGIYLPEENIGVRIEDTLVVTENGAKDLSAALPREPGEIEKLVAK
ncbi:MAG TPA: aminopeptidase P N-terminal domain-containing protein [Bryobacteraceae bacterium]|nr:aminopeptidase P N-terminal domain-containing protein [Bryobacteraceae bacterium]